MKPGFRYSVSLWYPVLSFGLGAQNLRQGTDMKISFEWVSRMGLGSFVDINNFVMKYYFIQFLHILHFC